MHAELPANLLSEVAADCERVLERVCLDRTPVRRAPSVLLGSIHDGDRIPACAAGFVRELPAGALSRDIAAVRDWGADAMAASVATKLGLGRFHRATYARALIDCGRAHGLSEPNASGLETRSVPYAIAGRPLPSDLRDELLAEHRRYLAAFERLLAEAPQLIVSIHTYDPVGDEGERAPIGLIYRPWQEPERRTAAPKLVSRLADGFERAGFRVNHNHPYSLAPGGPELIALERLDAKASALVIEYRKDLVVDGTMSGGFFRPRKDEAKRDVIETLGRVTASALGAYLREVGALERAA